MPGKRLTLKQKLLIRIGVPANSPYAREKWLLWELVYLFLWRQYFGKDRKNVLWLVTLAAALILLGLSAFMIMQSGIFAGKPI